MMRTERLSLLLIALALFTLPCFANNILDGSFESPMVPPSSTCGAYGAPGTAECFHTDPIWPNSIIGNWVVIGNSDIDCSGGPCVQIPNAPAAIMLMTNGYTEPRNGWPGTLSFNVANGSQAVDLTGEGNQGNNGVKQTVMLNPGTYSLSFALGHQDSSADGYAGASSLALYINGVQQQIFSNNDNTTDMVTWDPFSYSFSASGATTIAFLNSTPVGNNYAGLDNVVLVQTPEPASLLLLGCGLLALAGLKLHKRSTSH